MASKKRNGKKRKHQRAGLTGISIEGYKSLVNECHLEIRPLTILAGANSSGKSSAIQPLMLVKQTIEASYDPGALLIHGPNVRFNNTDELLSKIAGKSSKQQFSIKLELDSDMSLQLVFKKTQRQGFKLLEMIYNSGEEETSFHPNMTLEEITSVVPNKLQKIFGESEFADADWSVERFRCFFALEFRGKDVSAPPESIFRLSPSGAFEDYISGAIHVPGLRGNPERTYKTTGVGSEFSGTFEIYVASIIDQWQKSKDKRLNELGAALETLGLTWKVEAQRLDDTQVALRVGRLPHSRQGGAKDLVNIADVGFGVSQSLPVIIALLTAKPHQLVYLEQPEIHLHPCGQVALAKLLADAANRGVRIIAETHSSLLLLAVQTLVANKTLKPNLVKLHWFKRDELGVTNVTSADLDQTGAFGDWPEDFDDVILNTQSSYLDAAETVL